MKLLFPQLLWMHPIKSHKSKLVDVKFDLMVSNPILLSQRRASLSPGLLPSPQGLGFPKGWARQ